MIFTIQQVILIVLYYSNNAAQYIVHGTLAPSMGVWCSFGFMFGCLSSD
jgi:hypothetical protein